MLEELKNVYILVQIRYYVSCSHDVTQIPTTKLLILLRFYFHDGLRATEN